MAEKRGPGPKPNPESRIVRVRDVRDFYSITEQTIKRWELAGEFPKRRAFGKNVKGWWREDFELALEAMAGEEAPDHDTEAA